MSDDTSLAGMILPEGLDPTSIVLNYTSPYGDTQIHFYDLDEYLQTRIELAVVFGVRIGLAALAIPITYIISKNKKSALFILNECCLFTLFLHSILYASTMTKAYNSITAYFSLYIYIDKPASNLVAATNAIYILLIILVEMSMVYQVHIIFRSPSNKIKSLGFIATGVSGLLGLTTIGLYFGYASMANIALFDINYSQPGWIMNAALICFSCSSCIMTLLLSFKLFFAIRTRRFLGLKQFGIFHILLIMSCQTMIVPTLLIFLSFSDMGTHNHTYQSLSALGTTLITISLPVTTMWANSSMSDTVATSTSDTYFQKTITSSESSYSTSLGGDTPVEGRGRFFWKEVQYFANGLEPDDLEEEVDDNQYFK
ncbi:hypothetical protein CANARDRAFT_177263 [[Candida] arabinofermentans NRRL YB-2248]|uniref:Pheromone alpha factor receptor n=1 Tax=[Candida] arabinofermentans NRRL YB-2248 TaxID=983967 RepID=A0A1E4SX74_9ASCO|nr:hypothetical protein CANARDRAFT_177263 [[Candida] arabinofermentans NRRL YB-2248]